MSKRSLSPLTTPSATINTDLPTDASVSTSPIPSGVSIEQVNGLIASVASALGALYQAPVYRHVPPTQ